MITIVMIDTGKCEDDDVDDDHHYYKDEHDAA